MTRMEIYGVSFDLVGKQPIVLLKTAEGNKFLPIWIGHSEAAAILMKLQNTAAPRPLTHDLLVNILGELEVEVVRVTVTELRENTFHASITVAQNGHEFEGEEVNEEEIIDEFKSFLDRVSAEDFAEAEVEEEEVEEREDEEEEEER